MSITDSHTIAQGKAWLRAKLSTGAPCPLCTQHAQTYRRKINSGMARSLIHMYRTAGTGWVHVKVIGAGSREEGKLAYWGLVEEQLGTGLHGGRAGYWRVTHKGVAFIRKEIRVPKYARIYNGKVVGFDHAGGTDIIEALGTRFDYDDLLKGV